MPPREARGPVPHALSQTPAHITTTIQTFLAEHPNSLLMEDGQTLFDLRETQYAVTAEHDRATLHLWSTERNLVRRILAVNLRSRTLRLSSQRLGQTSPQLLELTPDTHTRTPTTRDSHRQRYLRRLTRALTRTFPDHRAEAFRSAMDLERSFGPAYARGILTRGQNAWAVIAVNSAESQATIDGILTLGILWLQHCRDHAAPTTARASRCFGGLRLVLPQGAASTTLSRLAWLDARLARYELYEFNEQTEDLTRRDPEDSGNLTARLIHAPNFASALDRFAEAIPRVLALLPPNTQVLGLEARSQPSGPPSQQQAPQPSQSHRDPWSGAASPNPAHRNHNLHPATPTCELRLRSSTELAFLLHGLEFARIRSAFAGQSFNRQLEITVGSGAAETILLPATQTHLRELVRHLFDRRRPDLPEAPAALSAPTQDPLFRTQPERWLQSALKANLPALEPSLEPYPVYTEVPALTGAGASLDRGMLDLLAVTRDHRLAVIELKAEEDLHLALQGLDYWIRIRRHHLIGADTTDGLSELQRSGYFPATRLGASVPQLFLVAPALHIHSATETILRHLSQEVPWTLVALDERWRTRIKPIWRKRRG